MQHSSDASRKKQQLQVPAFALIFFSYHYINHEGVQVEMQLMVSGSESDMQDEDVLSKKHGDVNRTGGEESMYGA